MIRKIFAFSLLLVFAVSCNTEDSTPDFSAIDKKIIEDYLVAHSLTAQSTSSGLYYIITAPGGTTHPTMASSVKAFYKGYLADGSIFDQSTYTTGNPATFPLTNVITGWQEGLQLVGVGGKIKLLIPSAMGYGGVARTGIPMNSVLIFDISVVDIYN
jgi:FKBP-type peptidyl-prolyl cis-trans isomerase FkpA